MRSICDFPFTTKYLTSFFSRKENCAITYDLFNFAKKLETVLCRVSILMRKLRPSFTLVGSVPEHTRIGIANELDITIDFLGWIGKVPFKTVNDAYNLYRFALVCQNLNRSGTF